MPQQSAIDFRCLQREFNRTVNVVEGAVEGYISVAAASRYPISVIKETDPPPFEYDV